VTDTTVSLPIIDGRSRIPVSWGRVETESMRLPRHCYRQGRAQDVSQIIMHHGAFSAAHAWDVLRNRSLSYHICIDSDGTIYQMVDLADTAWHAGSANGRSVGICLANPSDIKWRDHPTQAGRPVSTSPVHGVMVEHLDFFPIQAQAAKSLVRAIAHHYEMPLTVPPVTGALTEDDQTIYTVIGHYHLGTRKIDPVGLNFEELISP
jgi:N-acetyl-anhydromuramyl-L-alanine amidase AmpD